MSVPRAIIFDLDGTLADSVHDIAASMNAFLQELGLPGFGTTDYLKWIGGGSSAMVAQIAQLKGLSLGSGPDGLLARYLEHYKRNLTRQTAPFPGVEPLLQACATHKIPMAILSNKDDWMVQVVRDKIFPDTPFVEVMGLSDVFPRKPDPAAACHIADRMGVQPTDCLLVGDTVGDILTARAAHMQSAGAFWGYGTRRTIAQAQPDYLFEDPAQLETLIRHWYEPQYAPAAHIRGAVI